MDTPVRCGWEIGHPLMEAYHDHEWCKPLHDERSLFEMLILEGQQAGLSWMTIIKKRAAFKEAFDNFEPEIVASYTDAKQQELLTNEGIIRNRLKIKAAITNAQAFLRVQDEFGSFDSFLWNYVDGEQIDNRFETLDDIPATSPLSDALSKDLKKRGFTFVGSTIMYSYLQGSGLINDHLMSCSYRDI